MFKLFNKKLNRGNQLDDVLQGFEVRPFPKAVMRLLRILRDPETSSDDVAEAVQWDPGIVMRVLRTVNSAAYAPARPIENVNHAVSFMGRAQLEQLVLAIAVRQAVPNDHVRGFEPARHWRAASRRAALARSLSERIQPSKQAECFTVGLLSDMAVPVLAAARPSEYGPVLETWNRESNVCLSTVERGTGSWSHGHIGGLLGERWELPDSLVRAIEGHHDNRPDDEVPAGVRLVTLLADNQAEHGVESLVETARSEYGLEPDFTVEAFEQAVDQAAELAELMT